MSSEDSTRPTESADLTESWEMGRMLKTFTGHMRRISSIAVSEDGKQLYTGSVDGTSRRWDVSTGSCVMVYENNGFSVTCMHVKGKFLWTGGASFNNTIRKWDVKLGKELAAIEKAQGHRSGITALRTDENNLYSGSWDGTVKSWKITTCDSVATYEGHQAGSQIKALSVSGDSVATGSTDKTCRIFDKATAECQTVITLDFGVCGVLLRGDSVFIGTKDSRGFRFSAATGKKEFDLAAPDDTFTDLGAEHPSSGFKDLCMSHVNGGCIVAANRSVAHFWDVQTGMHLHTIREADNVDVNAVCLVPALDEKVEGRAFVFTGLDDNSAHMYSVNQPVPVVPAVQAVPAAAVSSTALSPVGSSASSGSSSAPVVAKVDKTAVPGHVQSPPSSCCVVS